MSRPAPSYRDYLDARGVQRGPWVVRDTKVKKKWVTPKLVRLGACPSGTGPASLRDQATACLEQSRSSHGAGER